jgi:hypothetical protein
MRCHTVDCRRPCSATLGQVPTLYLYIRTIMRINHGYRATLIITLSLIHVLSTYIKTGARCAIGIYHCYLPEMSLHFTKHERLGEGTPGVIDSIYIDDGCTFPSAGDNTSKKWWGLRFATKSIADQEDATRENVSSSAPESRIQTFSPTRKL